MGYQDSFYSFIFSFACQYVFYTSHRERASHSPPAPNKGTFPFQADLQTLSVPECGSIWDAAFGPDVPAGLNDGVFCALEGEGEAPGVTCLGDSGSFVGWMNEDER